jgi:hypothetical protein
MNALRPWKKLLRHRTVTYLPPLSVKREELMKKGLKRVDPFVIDYTSAENIVSCLPELSRSIVLEVNPGYGVLTRALVNAGTKRIISLEHNSKHFFPLVKSLESEVDDGRLRTVFCKWSRVDAEADPTYPSSLTSKALLADVQQRSWEDDVLGYIVGIKPQTHVKSLFRYLMTVLFEDSVMSWGRWVLAWLCDWKTAQDVVALPGSAHYGRLSIKSQIVCDVDNVLTVPGSHVYPQRRAPRGKKEKSPATQDYYLIKFTPKKHRIVSSVSEAEFFHETLRQLTARMKQPLGETLV